MTPVMGSTAEAYDRLFTVGRSHGAGQTRPQAEQADRSLLLADAERLEDLDHAGGVRAALQCDPGKHREGQPALLQDRKSTRLNSSHTVISYAVFCLQKKKIHLKIDE